MMLLILIAGGWLVCSVAAYLFFRRVWEAPWRWKDRGLGLGIALLAPVLAVVFGLMLAVCYITGFNSGRLAKW